LHTFYINLDHRTDRRDALENQLSALGLSSTRVSAITPMELSEGQRDFCKRTQRTSDPIIEVELCCNLSHQRALEAFLATSDDYALILEDDALLASDLPEVLAEIERVGMPSDLLRLETYIDRTQFGLKPHAHYGRYSARTMHSYTWGTAGYVVNRKAAERYARSTRFDTMTTDRALWRRLSHATDVKILQLYPAPIVQIDRLTGEAAQKSNIEETRKAFYDGFLDREPIPAKLSRFCRDEFTIALPALLHRWFKLSDRGSIPFSGEQVCTSKI
jgi:glycosyl transferase family 25